MEIIELPLAGAKLIRPRVFRDARGFFLESFSQDRYREAGMPELWVQDNHSLSCQGTLRGLHYQSKPGQAKLVRVTRGRIFDAIVDIRPSSPTFGKWHGLEIDAEEHSQVYVPVGFAHGFCVLSETAEVAYKCTDFYDRSDEVGVRWNDPAVGIAWPIRDPLLSEKDAELPTLAALSTRLGG